MRTYYCISSIQMEIPENALLNDEKRKYFSYIISGFDNYSLTKCSVFVAPDNTVQLKIERNNQIIYIPLKHESIIIKFSDTINNIIDLEFDDAEFRLGALDRLMVKSMRIRNIKNSSIKGFSEDDKQNFKNYLKLVHDNIRKKVLKFDPSLNPNDDLSQILTTKFRD
uniref:Uncharacterized protein n=1 Tax=Panagrolaimus sp. PS1159 TaxID=55785 RepID=A0AC35GBY2_9BILA